MSGYRNLQRARRFRRKWTGTIDFKVRSRSRCRRPVSGRYEARKIGTVGDQGRDAVSQELMRTNTRCAAHRTGNSTYGAAELVRAPCDGHRSRADASLNYDGCCGERGHQPRPSEEAVARRHGTGWNLADHEAEVCHSLK